MRKRQAARLRQQRCRARKKELSLVAKKQAGAASQQQQEENSDAQVPAVPTRNPHKSIATKKVVVSCHLPHFAGHHQPSAPANNTTSHPHQPHRPHQPYQPRRPQQPHHHLVPHMHRHHPGMHIPPPPGRSRHHHQQQQHHPSTLPHRILHTGQRHFLNTADMYNPIMITRGAPGKLSMLSRMQQHSIGSVVSFDDGSYPPSLAVFPQTSMPLKKQSPQKREERGGGGEEEVASSNSSTKPLDMPTANTVSPTEAANRKPIVEPDLASLQSLAMPTKSPGKVLTAVEAMLSLRSAGNFGA